MLRVVVSALAPPSWPFIQSALTSRRRQRSLGNENAEIVPQLMARRLGGRLELDDVISIHHLRVGSHDRFWRGFRYPIAFHFPFIWMGNPQCSSHSEIRCRFFFAVDLKSEAPKKKYITFFDVDSASDCLDTYWPHWNGADLHQNYAATFFKKTRLKCGKVLFFGAISTPFFHAEIFTLKAWHL